MVDESKLQGDLWVRRMWAPKEAGGIQDRPIVLVGDRRRWRIADPCPTGPADPPMAISVAGARSTTGGQAGYYEVREDGSLGGFLGRRTPLGLSEMRRTKP